MKKNNSQSTTIKKYEALLNAYSANALRMMKDQLENNIRIKEAARARYLAETDKMKLEYQAEPIEDKKFEIQKAMVTLVAKMIRIKEECGSLLTKLNLVKKYLKRFPNPDDAPKIQADSKEVQRKLKEMSPDDYLALYYANLTAKKAKKVKKAYSSGIVSPKHAIAEIEMTVDPMLLSFV